LAGHVAIERTTGSTAALVRLFSLVVLVLIWEIVARLVGSRLLPPASTVAAVIVRETASGTLPRNLAITCARIACAFMLSMVLGTMLGLAMGLRRGLDLALDSWLTVLLNLPALVVIVLAYVWFGLTEFSLVLAVTLNKLPATAVTVREGARALDRDLAEMARSFGMPRRLVLRHVVLPQLIPYLIVAARSGLALIWKIILVAELLGRSSGAGFQIGVFFQLFDVAGILAYTIAFGLIVQLIEWALLQPLERQVTRWRR
jgi:NitT/TauT family transport system permease protein